MHRLLASTFLALTTASAVAHDARHGAELFQPGLDEAEAHAPSAGAPPSLPARPAASRLAITAEPEAQSWFGHGLDLVWGFNHAEAIRFFRAGQAADPGCAMCYWGEALALGPNINDAMAEGAVRPAWDAIRRAETLAAGTNEKEQALIAALARRYRAAAAASRSDLDADWAEAIGEVAARWPDDPELLVLQAEALMNLQPWDYWEDGGVTPKGHGAEIVAVLEQALALAPDHPGALHLYIHAVEASADPSRAEAAADRLRAIEGATGHLLHMPAHIYMRVGRHADSVEANRAAIAADEAFLAEAGEAASPLYRFGYYPHNVHFLMASAQMAGLATDVIAAADRLVAITSDAVSEEIAWVQAIRTAPYTGHAQFSEPEVILALPDPGTRFPFVRGFWHYARGLAEARAGRPEAALAEVRAIRALVGTADLDVLEAQYLPARDILTLAGNVVEAKVAAAAGDVAGAEALLRQAIALEDAIAYMEPPFWYYPVRQTLGAVLLAAGRPEEAAEAFRAALAQTPRNGWALWGLAEAERAAGADPAATEALLEKAWLGDRGLLTLDRL